MEIYCLCTGSWQSNCYVLVSVSKDGKIHSAVVDPGVDEKEIVGFFDSLGTSPEFILLTHGHFDHVCSLDALREKYGIPSYIHENDAIMLSDGEKNAYTTFFGKDFTCKASEKTFTGGQKIALGDEEIEVLHTPGHTKGSSCFLCPGSILVTGDTVFAQGFGRCDLYGGDSAALKSSINGLRGLDGNLKIYPGHGKSATLKSALNAIDCYF